MENFSELLLNALNLSLLIPFYLFFFIVSHHLWCQQILLDTLLSREITLTYILSKKWSHTEKSLLPWGKLRTVKRAVILFSLSVVRGDSAFEICAARLQISVSWLMNQITFYFLNVWRIHPVVFPRTWGLEQLSSTSGCRQSALGGSPFPLL